MRYELLTRLKRMNSSERIDTHWGPARRTAFGTRQLKLGSHAVVSDPYLLRGAHALDRPLWMTGMWRVYPFGVKVPRRGERVAFVLIRHTSDWFHPDDVHWERAEIKGEPASLKIDYALGCVCSEAAAARIREHDATYDRMCRQLEGVATSAALRLPKAPLVIFGTGMGDGAYPLWWSLTPEGQIRLIGIDFQILSSP